MYEKVREFRQKLQLPISDLPVLISSAESSYFSRFILEELSEYMRACEEGSLVDAADALVDLVYVTLGCAHAMGLPFNELFDIVHTANMKKQPANEFVRSLRGTRYDVVKPMGWVPPEEAIQRAINTYLTRHNP
jgi:hypothetical protein